MWNVELLWALFGQTVWTPVNPSPESRLLSTGRNSQQQSALFAGGRVSLVCQTDNQFTSDRVLQNTDKYHPGIWMCTGVKSRLYTYTHAHTLRPFNVSKQGLGVSGTFFWCTGGQTDQRSNDIMASKDFKYCYGYYWWCIITVFVEWCFSILDCMKGTIFANNNNRTLYEIYMRMLKIVISVISNKNLLMIILYDHSTIRCLEL